MLRPVWVLALSAAASAAAPAHGGTFNLSCDDGGMLLTIDTDRGLVTDRNPFRQTMVTVPLAVTAQSFAWHEGSADYRLDRASGLVEASAGGRAISFADPKCGKSAILRPKS